MHTRIWWFHPWNHEHPCWSLQCSRTCIGWVLHSLTIFEGCCLSRYFVVLFSRHDQFGDRAVGWIITVTKNSDVVLNPFQAPNKEDGIALLNNPHLNNLPEVRSLAVCTLQVAIFYFTSSIYFSHLLCSTDYPSRHFFHCLTGNDHRFCFCVQWLWNYTP